MTPVQNHLLLNRPEDNSNHSENRPIFLTVSKRGFEGGKVDVPAGRDLRDP
jgi:hypothetical protein